MSPPFSSKCITLPLKGSSAKDREGKACLGGSWKGGQGGGNKIYHCGLINYGMNVWTTVLNWNQHQTVIVKN